MRAATEFMLSHMRGRELGFLDHGHMTGHDGIGWTTGGAQRVGHGIGGNYFDLLPMGPRDLHASVRYVQALRAMAAVEAHIENHPGLDSARPSISPLDGTSAIVYSETSVSLTALAEQARAAIHAEFWDTATARYGGWRDQNGILKDYGFAHFNLEAIAAGIGEAGTNAQVLDWLDGRRIVPGDVSNGADIYRWRFASRFSTRRNLWDYFWGWPGSGVAFGEQVQDGGAVLFTTFYDVKARLAANDVEGAWQVWNRMLAHHSDVLAHGGTGPNFYRAYYQAHPEAGTLQGGGTAGGLGLDEEFVESALVAGAWVKAWLGVEALAADLLRIAPSLPAALTEMGARHIVYRGSVLQLRVAHGEIDLRGSSIGGAGRVRLVFRGPFSQQAELLRNGQADSGEVRHEGGALIADTTLAADLFTVFDPGEPEPDGGDPEPDGGGGDTGPGPDGGNLADGVETDDSRRGDSTGQVGDSEAATMITQGCGCFNADPHLVVLWLVPLLLWRRRSSAGRGENVVLCHARRLLH